MLRILHIDDNPDDVMLLKMVMEGSAEVTGVDSWKDAEKMLKNGSFDLVVVDYVLRDGDGLRVVEKLAGKLPVVMLTGRGNEEVAVRAIKLGASDYVVKSAEGFARMREVVEEALERHRRAEREKRELEMMRSCYAELDRSNRFRGLLIDVLHHDLMNPAGLALSFLELAEAACDSREAVEHIRVVRRNVNKIISIIDDVKELSKLESLKRVEMSRVALSRLWRSVIEDMGDLLADREVRFIRDASGRIEGNEIIKQALANLLSNAIKYSPPGSPITIRVWEDGEYAYTSIADEGEGVPDEYKRSIFDRFTRLDKEGVKGSGIGLAIVRRIVELHRGEVWVGDNSPRGAVFYLKFPKRHSC